MSDTDLSRHQRLEVNINPETAAILRAIKAKYHINATEVIRRALTLWALSDPDIQHDSGVAP